MFELIHTKTMPFPDVANCNDTNLFWVYRISSVFIFCDMPHFVRRDIFACGKSDIAPMAQWYSIHLLKLAKRIALGEAEYHCRRQ